MREMRLKKREIREPEILKEILEECEVLRIGGHDREGMFIVPVNYGYDFESGEGGAKLTLYIHGAGSGRKADAFMGEPDVAVEMDCRHGVIKGGYACSYSFSYRSIMGNGKICRVEETEEKMRGLNRIMEHMAPGAKIEFLPEMLERVEVFRIDVKQFTGKERKMK